jgi:hypothetical protein
VVLLLARQGRGKQVNSVIFVKNGIKWAKYGKKCDFLCEKKLKMAFLCVFYPLFDHFLRAQ